MCRKLIPRFQWLGVNPQADKRLKWLGKQLRSRHIDFRPESYNWSVIQALLSRGDRRLSSLLELTREYGDSLGSYKRAFKQLRGQLPDLNYYVHTDWEIAKTLPWSHIQGPLSQKNVNQAFR